MQKVLYKIQPLSINSLYESKFNVYMFAVLNTEYNL